VRELRLEVLDYQNLTRWRWRLTGGGGKFLVDHEVRLDSGCWQYEAFTDLLGHLSWHAAPDRRDDDEARIVREVGTWIGTEVFGPVAAALARERPTAVRVIVPDAARGLLFRPLELAYVNGVPLALRDVTLVMQPAGDDSAAGVTTSTGATGAVAGSGDAASAVPAGGRLRVLGLFSLPEGGQPLNLRRERYELVQLVRKIAAGGRSADVRVLQYGVTRRRLQEVLEEAEGWDVIHISGHGRPGELLFEKEDGTRDTVSSRELAEMLDMARERVKLVTVSACWSAALTIEEQRRLLGLPLAEGNRDDRTGGQRDGFEPGVLATELTDRLGCAVLAMRYPVGDEFAIALSGKLYDLLADKGQPLPRAVGLALRHVLADKDGQGGADAKVVRPSALSVATPAIFGGRAVGLTLRAPDREGADSYATGALKMAGIPPQPDRFVGRTGVMARASAALAAESRVPGVLLYGMPGGGKTACALELAYTHEHAFDRLVWYKAPDEGLDITGSLTDFALTLERDLPGFQMIHVLADAAKLAVFTLELTELVERRRALIVIDNVETLLTSGGEWRDERWGKVVGALCAHQGLGRVVFTSRRLPTTGLPGIRVEAVDALSADEALLLARELPHLYRLILGDLPGVDREFSRRQALGVLTIAQGHPKLLELADGQAADPETLAALMAVGDQAWREQGGLPDGFFTSQAAPGQFDIGQATASAADYLHVLDTWTWAVAGGLPPAEQTLFWFLCCLEEPDRRRPVLDGNWAGLWTRLELDGQPPALDRALTAIAAQGLIAVRPETDSKDESYAVHPGVAAAGRAQAGTPFRDAADIETAAYWATVFRYASGENDDGTVHTGLLVLAGLAAVPYLIRRQQWAAAGTMLEHSFVSDPSRANAAAMLPAIQEIAEHEARAAGVLARVLAVLDPAEAERQMRSHVDAAVTRGDYRGASVTTGRLADLCRASGRLAEALNLTEQQAGYTRQAGLGPWTQLAGEARRLQVLSEMGQADQVLAEVRRLRDRMQALPMTPGPDETMTPWNIRETLLGTGRYAARQLERWEDALDLNAASLASMRDRSAPAVETARAMYNDYAPLLRLGRTGEALALLLECRRVFQDARDIQALGNTFSALADTEEARGHGDVAIGLERDALRYKYLAEDVTAIAVGYHNLGNYLRRHARQPAPALACHLAAALIRAITSAEGSEDSIRAAVADLRALGGDSDKDSIRAATPGPGEPRPHAAPLAVAAPASASTAPDAAPYVDVPPVEVPDLCHQVSEASGTDLAGLLAVPASEEDALEQLYQEVVDAVREVASRGDGEGDATVPSGEGG
jgi:tetratricopeptide (TPR) repeat protein